MLKKDTTVTITDPSSRYYKKVGWVNADQTSESWVGVSFELDKVVSEAIHPDIIRVLMKANEYRKGDRVEIINNLGRNAGKVGTVEGTLALMADTVNVRLDDDRGPMGMHYSSILLIDPAPRSMAHRTKGAVVSPEDVKKGDLISVKVTTKHEDGYESQTTSTGAVGHVSGGQITTSTARVLWDYSMDKATITLVEPVTDEVAEALHKMKINRIITWNYGKYNKPAVALKVDERKWHMIGATGPLKVTTDRIREYLNASGDSYTILDGGN